MKNDGEVWPIQVVLQGVLMGLRPTDGDEERWRHVAHASRRAVSRVLSTFRTGRRHDCRRGTPGGVRHRATKGESRLFFKGAVSFDAVGITGSLRNRYHVPSFTVG